MAFHNVIVAELSPVLMSGTFMAVLAALMVNKYLTNLIAEVIRLIRGVLPKVFTSMLDKVPIVNIIVSLFVALIVLALLFMFVIRPVYRQSIEENNSNKSS